MPGMISPAIHGALGYMAAARRSRRDHTARNVFLGLAAVTFVVAALTSWDAHAGTT